MKSSGSQEGVPRRSRKASTDEKEQSKPKEFLFKRINTSKFNNAIKEQFADNSFEAKARFGNGGDSYGSWSNSKLADKQGASFIKEKNKMKKRQSHASGTFNALAVNSVKF